MKRIRNFWFAHRERIARVIFWPYVISIVVFMLDSFYCLYQQLESGLGTFPQAVSWAIMLMGVLISPVLTVRAWSVVFHDDNPNITVVINSSIWEGGLLAAIDEVWLAGLMILLGLVLLNWLLPGLLICIVEVIAIAAKLVIIFVHLPILCIGYGIHLRKKHRLEKS